MKDYILIKTDTLRSFASNARRLGVVSKKLTTEEMIQIFSETKLPVDIQSDIDEQAAIIQQIKVGVAETAENLEATSNEISTQSALIQQIKAVLVEKGYQTTEE